MQTKTLLVYAVVGLLFLTISGWSRYFSARYYAEQKLETVSEEKARLNNAFARLMSDNAALDRERRVLEVEHRILQRKNAALGDDHRDLVQTHQGVQGQLAASVAQRDRLSRDLADARVKQDTVRDELDSTLAQRSRLMTQLGLARQLVERARAADAAGDGVLTHRLDQLRQSEELVALLGQRFTAANGEVRDRSRDLQRLNGLVVELGDELRSTNAEITLLRREVDEWKAANRMAWSQLQSLQQRLESELQVPEVQIERLKDNLTVIRLRGDILFDSGSAELLPAGVRALDLIARELSRFPNRPISLEGHTDAKPIAAGLRERFPSNWELSSARAARAARFLVTRGIDARRLRAVGYAHYRPAVAGGGRESLARNRRIEIMLLPPVEPTVVSSAPR